MRSEFEEKAIFALTQYYDSPYKLGSAFVIPNCSYFGHECDVLVISKSDYATEIELKASLSDLKADMKKWHKHYSPYIRQLYFGISEDIDYDKALEYIPENAGIILFYKPQYGKFINQYVCRITRRPKANRTANKINDNQKRDLLRTMYFRYYNLLYKKEWEQINAKTNDRVS
jgi:hypothetical protein